MCTPNGAQLLQGISSPDWDSNLPSAMMRSRLSRPPHPTPVRQSIPIPLLSPHHPSPSSKIIVRTSVTLCTKKKKEIQSIEPLSPHLHLIFLRTPFLRHPSAASARARTTHALFSVHAIHYSRIRGCVNGSCPAAPHPISPVPYSGADAAIHSP